MAEIVRLHLRAARTTSKRRRLAVSNRVGDGVFMGLAVGCVLLTALGHQAGWC